MGPSTENKNIKSFNDSFAKSGRLDAEYYQTKYDEILSALTSNNFDRLSDLVNPKNSKLMQKRYHRGYQWSSINNWIFKLSNSNTQRFQNDRNFKFS